MSYFSQVLPSDEFWDSILDLLEDEELDSKAGVNILKWHKKPREAVKVGDKILSIEVRIITCALDSRLTMRMRHRTSLHDQEHLL